MFTSLSGLPSQGIVGVVGIELILKISIDGRTTFLYSGSLSYLLCLDECVSIFTQDKSRVFNFLGNLSGFIL